MFEIALSSSQRSTFLITFVFVVLTVVLSFAFAKLPERDKNRDNLGNRQLIFARKPTPINLKTTYAKINTKNNGGIETLFMIGRYGLHSRMQKEKNEKDFRLQTTINPLCISMTSSTIPYHKTIKNSIILSNSWGQSG